MLRPRSAFVSDPESVTYLFTDIEGSTRLWEQQPERMRAAVARHDAITRAVIEAQRGAIVKMRGDGAHAVFDDALDAVLASVQLQLSFGAPVAEGIELRVRCGLHTGLDERRDNDYFGNVVNRAARISGAAHGGQVLLSQAVAQAVAERLPEGISLRELGLVRLRDLSRPELIFQLVHPQLRVQFPALRSLESTPNNLPQQLNTFVGREREIAALAQLLQANRLVTLLGMGGVGKSRLSLQLAAAAMDEFIDGVWLVELAPLSDPRLVPQAVASVLGVKEEGGRSVTETLLRFVADRQMLIILDNCEHLIEACAGLAKQLLQAGPRLKILATSRDHLLVAGETGYPVPTLSTPATRESTADELLQHEAVRLFVDRATAVQPAFRLDERTAYAVADICRRLDGIALALELAAARTKVLSVDHIAARLSDRFKLLVTRDETVLPRQRTLRALIDWSYDLLSGPERALLQRLAVFAGGWTLEAAEAVAASDGIESHDVLDLLANLVEKSLVIMEADSGRYRMLDTVQHYALEKLRESNDEGATRTRHMRFFVALAEQVRLQLDGPQQGAALSRLDADRENLRAAHAWSEHADDSAVVGLRFVDALRRYWIKRGLLTAGWQQTVETLGRAGLQARDEPRCRLLAAAGQLCSFMGRYAEARGYLAESLAIAREIGSAKWEAGVLQPLGVACLGVEDFESAREHFEQALLLARRIGDKREVAAAANALAQLHRMQRRIEAAAPLYEEAVALARELDDRESIAIGLLNLAMVQIERGDLKHAALLLTEVVAIAEAIGSKPAAVSALEVTAALASACEQWLAAARFFGAAEALIAATGLQRDPVDAQFLLPWIDHARRRSAGQFTGAEAAGRALAFDAALQESSEWLRSPTQPAA